MLTSNTRKTIKVDNGRFRCAKNLNYLSDIVDLYKVMMKKLFFPSVNKVSRFAKDDNTILCM